MNMAKVMKRELAKNLSTLQERDWLNTHNYRLQILTVELSGKLESFYKKK